MNNNKEQIFGIPEPVKYKTNEEIGEYAFGHLPDLHKNKKNEPLFLKFPHWIVDSGVLQVLNGISVKVLIVLNKYADFTTGNGRVSNKKISEISGVHLRSISSCRKNLEFFGIIKSWRRGWVRYYQIQMTPPPDIKEKVKSIAEYKLPKNTDIYHRDSKAGKFISNEITNTNPKNTEVAYP